MRLSLILTIIAISAAAATYTEGFDEASQEWDLNAGGSATARIHDGRLVLDMRTPSKGKWAYAALNRAITLPAEIEWDQCLRHDSRHTYFSGVSVLRGSGHWSGLDACLGGGGLDNRVILGSLRGDEGAVQPGTWYRIKLELAEARQVLTVTPRGGGEPVVRLQDRRALTRGPYYLKFFQNDRRLGPQLPDTYDQDRGIGWFDSLRITAKKLAARRPPEPGTSDPYAVPVVYNRATRWVTKEHGLSRGAIAYEPVGWMALTGSDCVSRWLRLQRWVLGRIPQWPQQPNIKHLDPSTTVFALPQGAKECTFALRGLQWNIEQHPTIEWEGRPEGVSWSLQITATDPVHPFAWELAQTEASAAADQGRIDLLNIYRESGRPNAYAEVDFLVHLHAEGNGGGERSLRLKMGLRGKATVVAKRAVTVTERRAGQSGVALEGIVVDGDGKVMREDDVDLRARVGGMQVTLEPVGSAGIRKAIVRGLPAGRHTALLEATDGEGQVFADGATRINVTDMPFASYYERPKRSYCTPAGEATGPLLGDLFAWVLYADLDSEHREMVMGLDQYRELDEAGRNISHTKWRVMPRAEIDRYFRYLADSGVRVVRITPNVQVREYYLDAGGHLAMHGFEQLGHILDAARRHGIRAVINLFHYPYNRFGPPVSQYFEMGYPEQLQWRSNAMWEHLSSYLDELLGYIGSDPAVMAYTVMGENDQALPVEWLNRAYKFVKERAPEHMVVLEQGGDIYNCSGGHPRSYSEFKAASDGGVGYRAYRTHRYPNDLFMAVCARFYDMAPPGYHGEMSCGIKLTHQFIVKLRDAMGLAATLQQPMAISWSAPPLEDTRKAFTRASDLIDWTEFRRAKAPVAIVVEKIDRQVGDALVKYEAALESVPIDCEYIAPDDAHDGYLAVFDSRREYVEPVVGESLPDDMVEAAPLGMSVGNHCSYALSADRRWMLAYVRNATRYEILPCDIRAVEKCRMADEARPLSITLQGFSGRCRYVVFDAATALQMRKGAFEGGRVIDFGQTAADLVIAVTPPQM